jgi:replicative DNA helicase
MLADALRVVRSAAEGYGDVGVIQEFVEAHEAAVYELARPEDGNATDAVMLGPAIRETFAVMQAAQERGERMSGTPTGFDRLDAMTAGQHDGDLTIVAARPGVGKTSFVMNVGVNIASPRAVTMTDEQGYDSTVMAPGLGVVVFSLEMPREQLAARIVCSEARVDVQKLRQGMLQLEDWRRMTDAASRLSDLPLWIDDSASQTVLGIRAKVRRIQAQYNRPAKDGQPERRVGLVVADYLQLLKSRDGLSSREQEISEISRGLKQLAKELKVPVIALSQLNRDVEKRGKNGRPQLSDLRESGAIEQDADTIIFIYRDEMANPDTDARGIAELIIGKQRNGPTGKVLVRFASACTRFDNLDPREYRDFANDE